jgi:hypothetical protein
MEETQKRERERDDQEAVKMNKWHACGTMIDKIPMPRISCPLPEREDSSTHWP